MGGEEAVTAEEVEMEKVLTNCQILSSMLPLKGDNEDHRRERAAEGGGGRCVVGGGGGDQEEEGGGQQLGRAGDQQVRCYCISVQLSDWTNHTCERAGMLGIKTSCYFGEQH